MADSGGRQRQEVHFRGRVQGVGFRWTTQRVASRFEVTGYVKNLADGRVLLVVEGEAGELRRFLDAVEEVMGRYISDASVTTTAAIGEIEGFGIRY